MSLPALAPAADTRSITERVNVLIRAYNEGGRAVPAGVMMPFGGTAAPDGFLLCDGSAVSRATYYVLFAAVGTTYGAGDGSTTFNLPDLRGRVAAGKDNMGGSAANRITNGGSGIVGTTLGAAGGAETHTLTTAQMPVHAHTVTAGTNPPLIGPTGRGTWGDGVAVGDYGTGNTGGGGAHPNVQPTIILNWIIST
jgi:microcystin-dependent protein